jgi:hypothetical protein
MTITLILLTLTCLSYGLELENLCGSWVQTTEGQCVAGQECIDYSTTFVNQQFFNFLGNGTYTRTIAFATGLGACPIQLDGGTPVLLITTVGTIGLHGMADSPNETYTKTSYTPDYFIVEIKKDNKPIYYTSEPIGACQTPVSYWNNETIGCPCNGTWAVDIKRVLPRNLTECDYCPGRFFLQTDVTYGNLRYNYTSPPTLEITFTSTDSNIGYAYGNDNIEFVLGNSGPCSDGITLVASFLSLLALVLSVLIL